MSNVLSAIENFCFKYTALFLFATHWFGELIQRYAPDELHIPLGIMPTLLLAYVLYQLPTEVRQCVAIGLMVPPVITSAVLLWRMR